MGGGRGGGGGGGGRAFDILSTLFLYRSFIVFLKRMDLDEDAEQYGSHAGEYFYDGTGSQHIDDNIYVFQDMERELETLVRKFQIAPADLENLCQVYWNGTLIEVVTHCYGTVLY